MTSSSVCLEEEVCKTPFRNSTGYSNSYWLNKIYWERNWLGLLSWQTRAHGLMGLRPIQLSEWGRNSPRKYHSNIDINGLTATKYVFWFFRKCTSTVLSLILKELHLVSALSGFLEGRNARRKDDARPHDQGCKNMSKPFFSENIWNWTLILDHGICCLFYCQSTC